MIFNDNGIDIPDDLIGALESDTLVIFVGAGISAKMSPDQEEETFFPLFKELVREIGKKLGKSEEEIGQVEEKAPDELLGEWFSEGEPIHREAANILKLNENKKNIEPHKLVVNFWAEHQIGLPLTPRLVTTNFDRLLIKAIKEDFKDQEHRWPYYFAPALPPAKRFKGLCFLHGCVDNAEEMILTDKDIGRAYMEERWALDFAHNLFKEFNVLFLGYSLDDPPLKYLSLALETPMIENLPEEFQRKRWAYVPYDPDLPIQEIEQKKSQWLRKNVTPILYKALNSDYRILFESIKAFLGDRKRGFTERRIYLLQLAKSNPKSMPPYSHNRVCYFLKDDDLLREFSEINPHIDWFEILLDGGLLDNLLQGKEDLKDRDSFLAKLLGNWLMEDPEKSLLNLAPWNKSLSHWVFIEFLMVYQGNEEKELSIEILRKVIEFFRKQLKSGQIYPGHLERPIKETLEAGYIYDACWILFSTLPFEPFIKETQSIYYLVERDSGRDVSGLSPTFLEFDFESSFERFGDYYVKLVDDLFSNYLDQWGYEILLYFTNTFMEVVFTIKRTLDKNRFGPFHPLRRRGIDPNNDDQYHKGPEQFLFNSLRDLWNKLLDLDKSAACKVFQNWKGLREEGLQRLTLYAASKLLEADVIDNKESLDLISKFNKEIFWKYDEAQLLLNSLYKKAGDDQGFLIDLILKGPSKPDPEMDESDFLKYKDNMIINKLSVLKNSGSSLPEEADRIYKELSKKYKKPARKTPEHIPDIEDVVNNPDLALQLIISIKGRTFGSEDMPARDIGKNCINNPDFGMKFFSKLLEQIEKANEYGINSLIWGMQDSIENRENNINKEYLEEVIGFLKNLISKKPDADFWAGLPRFCQNLLGIWDEGFPLINDLGCQLANLFKEFEYTSAEKKEKIDWVQSGINHPFGQLTELYMNQARLHVKRQSENGLPYEIENYCKSYFEFVLGNYGKGSRYGLCLLFRSLSWFEAVDLGWAKENLIPWLSKWETHLEGTLAVWSGFLWDQTLSQHITPEDYINLSKHYESLGDSEKRGAASHLAGIIWFDNPDPSILYRFYGNIEGKDIAGFLNHFRNYLGKEEDHAKINRFFEGTLIPFWDWSASKGFIDSENGNEIKRSFWNLVPFSGNLLAKVLDTAFKYPPNEITSLYNLFHDLDKFTVSEELQDPYLKFLIKIIDLDEYAFHHKDYWQKLWLKVSGFRNASLISMFRDHLDRKKIDGLS